MGRLTNDMTRLSGEIIASRDNRTTFINGLKSLDAERIAETNAMLAAFKGERSRMSRQTKARLGTFAADLRNAVSDMLTDFRDDRSRMSVATKSGLKTFTINLRNAVAEIQHTTAAMLTDFRDDRSRMSVATKNGLKTFTIDLRNTVAEIRNTASEMLTGFRETHNRLSEDIKTDLSTFHSDLKGTVHGFRREVQADMAGARRAWTTASHAAPKIAKPKAAKPKVESRAKEPAVIESAVPEKVEIPSEKRRDDLTDIQGIGKGMQKRLNEAGLHSFAQIALSTPDILRSALGTSARLADVETWIEQAKGLAAR